MKARVSFLLPLALLALVALAGCGGSSSSSTGSASAGMPVAGTPVSNTSGGSATVDVANNPQLGKILVDSKGLTLYTFQKDTGSKSMCAGSCATGWPPLTTNGHPTAGGVDAGMLGTTKRSDGSMQVTYAGHPLYTFAGDSGPGQTTGNGINAFGAIWNAVLPSGAKAPSGGSSGGSTSTSSGSSSSTSSGSGGYGY